MKDDQQANGVETGEVLFDRFGRPRARYIPAADVDSDDILIAFDSAGRPSVVVSYPEGGGPCLVGLLDRAGNSAASVSMVKNKLAVIGPDGRFEWPLDSPMAGFAHTGGPR